MSRSDFKTRFVDTFSTAGQALEESGYDIQEYQVFLQGYDYVNTADNPLDAFEAMLDEVVEEDSISIYLSGEEFADTVREERDGTPFIQRAVRGDIDLVEPIVEDHGKELPAYGTIIRYVPWHQTIISNSKPLKRYRHTHKKMQKSAYQILPQYLKGLDSEQRSATYSNPINFQDFIRQRMLSFGLS